MKTVGSYEPPTSAVPAPRPAPAEEVPSTTPTSTSTPAPAPTDVARQQAKRSTSSISTRIGAGAEIDDVVAATSCRSRRGRRGRLPTKQGRTRRELVIVRKRSTSSSAVCVTDRGDGGAAVAHQPHGGSQTCCLLATGPFPLAHYRSGGRVHRPPSPHCLFADLFGSSAAVRAVSVRAVSPTLIPARISI